MPKFNWNGVLDGNAILTELQICEQGCDSQGKDQPILRTMRALAVVIVLGCAPETALGEVVQALRPRVEMRKCTRGRQKKAEAVGGV